MISSCDKSTIILKLQTLNKFWPKTRCTDLFAVLLALDSCASTIFWIMYLLSKTALEKDSFFLFPQGHFSD